MGDIQARTRQLLRDSISVNTRIAYDTAVKAFNNFRVSHGLSSCWPATRQQLVYFVASCFEKGFSPATISTYCSGISFYHKINAWSDPTDTFIITKMLEGCRRSRNCSDDRAPISKELLDSILKVLPDVCYDNYECKLFSAAYTLAYFGLLRVGELAFTTAAQSDRPLQYKDIGFNPDRSIMLVCIRKSKTNQRGMPTKLQIASSIEDSICCIKAMVGYLQVRQADQGYLFCHQNKKPLSRYQFASVLSKCIKALGLPCMKYKTHSFRIGRATELATSGVSMETIKLMGRWTSNVYSKYIRL